MPRRFVSEQKLLTYGIILAGGIALAWVLHTLSAPAESPMRQPAAAQRAPSGTVSRMQIGELTAIADDGWIQESPSSTMRLAQFRLPSPDRSIDDAELAVFSGIGGTVQDNLNRWFGQFRQADGSNSRERARVQEFTVGGMATTIADLSGTFTGGGMPMSKPVEKTGYRLLAAIVEGSSDIYYFKLVGPEETVEQWAGSFGEFIGNLRSPSL